MNKLGQENARLEEENAILARSNEQFQGLTSVSTAPCGKSNEFEIAAEPKQNERVG